MPETPEKKQEPNIVLEPETNEPEKLVDIQEIKETPKQETNDEALKKMHARMEYQARLYEKSNREQAERFARLESLLTQKPVVTQSQDEIDLIASDESKGGWKKAVDMMAERRFKELRAAEIKQQQEHQKVQSLQGELEKSTSRVREKYPEIDDETSDDAREYVQVLNENPQFLNNPYGPELAMLRMEEKRRAKGILSPDTKQTVDSAVEKEVGRRTRVGAGSLPTGGKSTGTPIVITQTELNMCKQLGISPQRFAENKKLDAKKRQEGISVK